MKVTSQLLFVHRFAFAPLLATALIFPVAAPALTITSGPTFTNAVNAPLAGTLQLTADALCRVSVSVSDGTNTWARDFYNYNTIHSFPLLGFKPGRTNEITVTIHDKKRNEFTAAQPRVFVTPALPSDLPKINVLVNKPDKMEPGYTLFRVLNNNNNKGYITIVDNIGEVVWYSGITASFDVRQLANGNLFLPLAASFAEVNMLGQTVRSWPAPTGWTVNTHDGVPTDHGTILYLNDASRTVTNFPNSATNPNVPHVTTNLLYNRVVEISATNSTLLNSWSLIDMLDPRRISYLTFSFRNGLGWDCEHANAVIEDPRDDSIIVSMRHQNAVIKFSRATGQLKWILGPHENWGPEFQPYLLTPVGTPFFWNYAQHAPSITPQGTLLIFDNGNFRASPFDTYVRDTNNYTRAVEYDINEQTMEVSQIWDYGRDNSDERIFTDRVGNADWLPKTGNVLVTFGNVNYINGLRPSPIAPNAAMLRIKEVTYEPVPEVVFDLALFDFNNTSPSYRGCYAYRSHRIADLYAHPLLPVTDLTVTYENDTPRLQFSADETHTYIIEASTNLLDWEEIGTAVSEGGGEISFDDLNSNGLPERYYRVVTQ